ncbi:hypothetical protein KRZ98_05280 [Sphingobium sp. AS12]|uniref:hypothetical protein n=1 Tax=Sphingobium sp. AS12 TaxID=2849495 RepID=UPI001C31B397|nr:hypothetical protein [Sphingobium sp. AS12]MBV2147698.1 hypothetical protein [Sphingobium sp. AS12]
MSEKPMSEPFSQLTFPDREQEVRAILTRMFMTGRHEHDDPDQLWMRLCDLVGLDQACLLAGGHQMDNPDKFDVIYGQHIDAANGGSIIAQYQLGAYYAARLPATNGPRDADQARHWFKRADGKAHANEGVIFGLAHWQQLAREALATLDADPEPALTAPPTTPPAIIPAPSPAPPRATNPVSKSGGTSDKKSAIVQFMVTLVAGPLGLFYSNIWLAIGLTLAAILTVGIFYVTWPLIWLVANIVGQIEVARYNRAQAA